MSKCDLAIELDRADRIYRPGEKLRGEVTACVNTSCRCDQFLISLQWRTHGRGNVAKGDPLLITQAGGEWLPDQQYRFPFEFTVPPGPATYHGELLNVDWYVMARADIPWAIDPKVEEEILLDGAGAEGYQAGPSYATPEALLGASGQGAGCAFAFGAVFALIGLGVLVAALLSLTGQLPAQENTWVGILVGVLFSLVGFGIALASVWKRIAQRKIGEPQVRVAPTVVKPGDRVRLELRLSPRATVTLGGVSVALIGREEVVSGSGTNRTTHRHIVHEQLESIDDGGRQIGPGEILEWNSELVIPGGAQPTFAASDNKLEWRIKLRIDIPDWPDWVHEYPISVFP